MRRTQTLEPNPEKVTPCAEMTGSYRFCKMLLKIELYALQWYAGPGLKTGYGLAQVTPDGRGLNALQAAPAEEREVAAIVAFAARYYSGMPFEVRV